LLLFAPKLLRLWRMLRVARVIRADAPLEPSVKGRPRHGLFFDRDDRTTHVAAAVGANHMRRESGAALRAVVKCTRLLVVVGSATVGAGVRLTSLWNGLGAPENLLTAKRLMLEVTPRGVKDRWLAASLATRSSDT